MSNTASTAPVTWFEIHTADPEKAKRFYADAFGWRFDDSMPGYSMILLEDDAPIGGGIAHTDGAYPNDAVFNVQVPDVAAALTRVTDAGGSIVADVRSTPFGLTFAYAANPDGSVFGLFCPPAAD
jgi:predicted enzyme related to lactoylglutathione lyase